MSSPHRDGSSRPTPSPKSSNSPELTSIAADPAPSDKPSTPSAPPSPSATTRAPSAGWSRVWIGVLLLALVITGSMLLAEKQHSGVLEGQVGALTADLETALAEIGAHEQRLGQIRAHVGDISDRVGALQLLVGEAEGPSALASPTESGVDAGPVAPAGVDGAAVTENLTGGGSPMEAPIEALEPIGPVDSAPVEPGGLLVPDLDVFSVETAEQNWRSDEF